jgi:carbohydrate diacid regulator
MSVHVDQIPVPAVASSRARVISPQRKNELLFDLLHGVPHDKSTLVAEARTLGIDLNQPRAVVLVDASDYALGPALPARATTDHAHARLRSREIISAIVAFFALPLDTICIDLGNGEIAILKASNSRNLDEWVIDDGDTELTPPSWANLDALKRATNDLLTLLRELTGATVSIGIGRYHPRVVGIAASYRDARAALSLGNRIHGPGRVHCLDELGLAAFLAVEDERIKADLAHHLLSPLDRQTELLETLDAFFDADCSPAGTTRLLNCHRNTLTYRLAKIAALTGLDPRRFDDAVQIRIARVLRGLDRRQPAPDIQP